jgi:hypothetical protein
MEAVSRLMRTNAARFQTYTNESRRQEDHRHGCDATHRLTLGGC